MKNNNIVSMVNMRLKRCSESDKRQQIVAVGTLGDKYPRVNEMPNNKKIRYLYAYGPEVINEIKNRMEIQKYKTDPFEKEGSFHMLGWSGYANKPEFSQDCAMRSFCHIAAKAMSNYKSYKQLKTMDLVNAYSQRKNKYSSNETYFGISACIKNEPGTIYALISLLTGIHPCVIKVEAPLFDLNVEHLRSCLCRVTKCVKIDLYGRYFKKQEQESTQYQNLTHLERLSNVQSIAFYDLDKDDSKINSIKALFHPYTCQDSECSSGCNDHVFNIVDTSDIGNKEASFETLVYKNKNTEGESKAKFRTHDCPVARLFGHENGSSQSPKTSCIFRKKEAADTEKEKKEYGKTIKIEACLYNVPGALKELAEVIAIQRSL